MARHGTARQSGEALAGLSCAEAAAASSCPAGRLHGPGIQPGCGYGARFREEKGEEPVGTEAARRKTSGSPIPCTDRALHLALSHKAIGTELPHRARRRGPNPGAEPAASPRSPGIAPPRPHLRTPTAATCTRLPVPGSGGARRPDAARRCSVRRSCALGSALPRPASAPTPPPGQAVTQRGWEPAETPPLRHLLVR